MAKSIIYKAIIFLFGCVLAFVFGEAVLRSLGYAASDIYTQGKEGLLILNPNKKIHIRSVCFQNDVKTNSLGFHSREYSLEKPTEVFRIAIIGDSFIEAMQVPLEKTVASLLEQKLNSIASRSYKYEVIPFGISSHGTYKSILYYENYVSQFNPDLVIEAMALNDIEDDALESDQTVKQPNGFLKATKKVLRKSVLITTLRKSYLIMASDPERNSDKLSAEVEILMKEYNDFWNNAWARQESLLKKFKDEATKNNSRFMLVSLTDGYRIHQGLLEKFLFTTKGKEIDLDKPEKILNQITEENSIPYLALTSIFRERAKSEDGETVWPCDGHWNERGHEWTSDALFDYLVSQRLVGN